MSYPQAVSPSVLTPGVYLVVDLLAGAASPGIGDLKVLVLGPKSSAGDLTAQTEIREGGGEASAATAWGAGTPTAKLAELVYQEDPTATVHFGAPTAGTGSATKDITASGSPAANTSILVDIGDTQYDVAWLASETADQWKTRAIAQLAVDDSPVVPSSGGTGILTLTGKVTGKISNDILVRANLSAASGTAAVDTNSLTPLVGGATDPDFTTILAAAAGEEYHYIVMALSNADAEATSTSNAAKLKTHIGTYNSGLDAKLQQGIYASTGSLSNAKTGVANRNSGFMQHVFCINGKGLPAQLAGREAGGRLAAIKLDPAANRIGEVLDGYVGADDVLADKPTLAESEDAIGSGLSIVSYNSSGEAVAVRPVTTYSLDGSGGADRRLLDTQNVDGAYIVARDIRTFLPTEFPKAKITRDTVPGEEPPPAGVLEERDVKSAVIRRLRGWVQLGVIQKAALEEAIADGSLIVQVNASDPTQVDLVLPYKIVQPVAKWGVVAQRRPG